MYAGRKVEEAAVDKLPQPRHPYPGLLDAEARLLTGADLAAGNPRLVLSLDRAQDRWLRFATLRLRDRPVRTIAGARERARPPATRHQAEAVAA